MSLSGAITPGTGVDIRSKLMAKYGFDPYMLKNFYTNHLTAAKIASGGAQILCMGDSIFAGTDSVNRNVNSIPGVIRSQLRTYFNQPVGCIGFVPCKYLGTATDAGPATIVSGSITNLSSFTTCGAQGYRLDSVAGATPNAISFTFTNSTSVPQLVIVNRDGATKTGTWTLTSNGGYSASGTYTYQNTTDGEFTAVIRSLTGATTTLVATDIYTLTINGRISDAGTQCWFAGILTYGAEWGSGIKVHNIAASGTKLFDFDNTGGGMYRADGNTTNEGYVMANNVTLFCSSSSATSGVTRTGLVICNWGTNGQGNYGGTVAESYGNIGLAAVASAKKGYEIYESYLGRFLEDLANQTSAPSVLMVDVPIASGRGPQLRMFHKAKEEMCKAMGVGYINLSKIYTPGDRTLTLPGGYDLDSIHFTTAGYLQFGTDIVTCITKGYEWWGMEGQYL